MRINLPVTGNEHTYADDATLMSTTDPKGRVRYANAAFVAVSGFSRDELSGKAHNIVRHPDVPPEAFADLWQTLQAGHAWSAVIKNRCKNGDHYWVRANVAPVVRGGQTLGYISVRTRPGAEEVQAATELHRRFREGKARGLRFDRGIVRRSGLGAWLSLFKTASVRTRAWLGCAADVLPPAAAVRDAVSAFRQAA